MSSKKSLAELLAELENAIVDLHPSQAVFFNDFECEAAIADQTIEVTRLKLHEVCRALFRFKTKFYKA